MELPEITSVNYPVVTWTEVPGATGYWLKINGLDRQYWYDDDDQVVYGTSVDLSRVLESALAPGTYTVQVVARNATWNEAFSTAESFTVRDASFALTGVVDAGESGYDDGDIFIVRPGTVCFPRGTWSSAPWCPPPGPYTLNNLPFGTDLHLYALWDGDGTGSRTPGDWTGAYGANPVNVASGGAGPSGVGCHPRRPGSFRLRHGVGYHGRRERLLHRCGVPGNSSAYADRAKTTLLGRVVIPAGDPILDGASSIGYTITGLPAGQYVYFVRTVGSGRGRCEVSRRCGAKVQRRRTASARTGREHGCQFRAQESARRHHRQRTSVAAGYPARR